MSADVTLQNVSAILPDRVLDNAAVLVRDGRIAEIGSVGGIDAGDGQVIDAGGAYLSPGFIDIHVHGGGGADFMDGTVEAVRALAPGWDPYALEAEWRGFWAATGRPRLRAPEKAYLAWVRKRAAQG